MGGVSSARNVGMGKAQGEWIVFVDPDDRLEPFYLQALYDAVANSRLPLGIGGFKEYYAGQEDVLSDHMLMDVPESMPLKDFYFRFDQLVLQQPWNKIFNAEFLRKCCLRFDETKSFGEDHFFCLQVLDKIEIIAIVPDCGYRYIRNMVSATKKYHANFKDGLKDVNDCERELLRKFGKTEEELEKLYVKSAPVNAYICIINYFKIGNGLSFRKKVALISEEILCDNHLIDAIRTHRFRWEGPYVTICTHLVLTQQAWMVVVVFQLLYFLKNHFMGLFNWMIRICR